MEVKRIKNKCTGNIIEIFKTKNQNKIEQSLYNEIQYFLKDNLKDINYIVSNNIFAKLEIENNYFEFKISDKIDFCFDISKLESDISNNCCDGVQIFFNNQDLQITNIYLYKKIFNSNLFKYYYYLIYSIIDGIKYHTANNLHNIEMENYHLDESDENYTIIDFDFKNEVFNLSIDFITE